MLKLNKNKFTAMFLMSMVSTILSIVMVTLLAVYNNYFKESVTKAALPLVFKNLALVVAILFCVVLLVMIIKRKYFKWFDFLTIALIIILWFVATINYSVMCASMKFPGDTDTLYGFYGIFLKTEVVKTYGLESPVTFMNIKVNFEFIISIILTIISSTLYFAEKCKVKKDKAM